jgi:hypothetical protein
MLWWGCRLIRCIYTSHLWRRRHVQIQEWINLMLFLQDRPNYFVCELRSLVTMPSKKWGAIPSPFSKDHIHKRLKSNRSITYVVPGENWEGLVTPIYKTCDPRINDLFHHSSRQGLLIVITRTILSWKMVEEVQVIPWKQCATFLSQNITDLWHHKLTRELSVLMAAAESVGYFLTAWIQN